MCVYMYIHIFVILNLMILQLSQLELEGMCNHQVKAAICRQPASAQRVLVPGDRAGAA